jgi:hypothetical protein
MIREQLQLQLSRTAALLAEIPTLKAVMTTRHAPTIQDGSTPFWKLAGSDLFLLADPGGKVMALHVTRPGLHESEAAVHLAGALKEGTDSAWWYDGGRLYWVFLRPITSGDGGNAKNLGEVAIGYEVDSSIAEQLAVVAESKIVLTADDKVIASTFSPSEDNAIQKGILGRQLSPGRNAQETFLGNLGYQVTSIAFYGGASISGAVLRIYPTGTAHGLHPRAESYDSHRRNLRPASGAAASAFCRGHDHTPPG